MGVCHRTDIKPVPTGSVELEYCDWYERNQVVCKNAVLKVTMGKTHGSSLPLLHYLHVAYNLKFVYYSPLYIWQVIP